MLEFTENDWELYKKETALIVSNTTKCENTTNWRFQCSNLSFRMSHCQDNNVLYTRRTTNTQHHSPKKNSIQKNYCILTFTLNVKISGFEITSYPIIFASMLDVSITHISKGYKNREKKKWARKSCVCHWTTEANLMQRKRTCLNWIVWICHWQNGIMAM